MFVTLEQESAGLIKFKSPIQGASVSRTLEPSLRTLNVTPRLRICRMVTFFWFRNYETLIQLPFRVTKKIVLVQIWEERSRSGNQCLFLNYPCKPKSSPPRPGHTGMLLMRAALSHTARVVALVSASKQMTEGSKIKRAWFYLGPATKCYFLWTLILLLLGWV